MVVVIMAELATIAFIFVAHDKASNRNKYKDFDQTLKLLCDVANFCINQMMLVMIGSFLCLSVVLQVAIEIIINYFTIILISFLWIDRVNHSQLQPNGQSEL